MQTVLGASANIKTINYSLNPVYSQGANPTIIGYQPVTNTVEATLTDLSVNREGNRRIHCGGSQPCERDLVRVTKPGSGTGAGA